MGIPGIPTIILWKNSREDWLTFTVSGEPHVHPPGVLVFFFPHPFHLLLASREEQGQGRPSGWEEREDARRVEACHLALACGVCCHRAPCWGEMLLGGEQGCSAALVAASSELKGFGSAWPGCPTTHLMKLPL